MKLDTIRHSLAHIMAHAVKELYPKAKFGIGPVIENGFYYDFDLPATASGGSGFSVDDLSRIETKMKELIRQNIKFKKRFVSKIEAKKLFKNQSYKLELIKELKGKNVSIYESNNFVDLCKGPHIKSTKEIPEECFKLTKIAGAYWRGSEKNKMLTRIYGLAFENKKALKDYINLQKEAEKRDHRIIGKKLDLFAFSELVGKGLPLFTPKGSIIRRELEKFIVEEEIKRGYMHVYTPDLARVALYEVSGHYPYYKDSMYPVMKIDEEELILRPMTCPHHYQLYLDAPRSYRDLPFRLAELAKQFRYEKSGELTGLMRVRAFCLADSHIICQKEKAKEEINKVLDLIEHVSSALGLEKNKNYRYRLSLGDQKDAKKYYQDKKSWALAEDILRDVLVERKAPFFEAKGEAAFYGPKIDIQMKNFAGKEETAFTVQYDFLAPKRFNLSYVDKDGKAKEPIVIHRSSVGAIERTIAFLLEHYKGALPLWLSPAQISVLPISQRHIKYAQETINAFEKENIRAQLNDDNATLSKKIREAEIQKIPYIVVIGDREEKEKKVSLRSRERGDLGLVSLSDFIERIKKEIKNKK